MKNKLIFSVFILFTLKSAGQTNVDLSKFFYNLPIDSCVTYIKTKTIDTNFYKARPSNIDVYKINTKLTLDNHNADSVIMRINCFVTAIGGSPNQVLPIVFEQWLTITTYFNSDSAANKYFINQKNLLDPFEEDPYLKKDANEIEWTYSFEPNVKRIDYRMIHLAYEIKQRKVRTIYRIIFNHNECNCD